MAKKYCIYIRVSTQKQGRSGLGLESQQHICREFIRANNGDVVAEFKDIESGTHRDRKGLNDAIAYCKANDCALVLAKLDRLARDVEFCFRIVNTGVEIHFCDMPNVNTLLLGVFATVAQYERELTSERTKKALRAKVERGEATGGASPKWRETFNKQTREQKDEYLKRRGCTINDKSLQKKEVQVFLRIVKKAFEFDNDDATSWDWTQINTRGENKNRLLDMMKDFRDLDDNGVLFHTWNFNDNKTKLQIKLATLIKNTRRMVFYRQKNNY